MANKILYQTYFVCKYCQKSYKKPKEFVEHKLRDHESEMERDYGSKIKQHSFFNVAKLGLDSPKQKTESTSSAKSQAGTSQRNGVSKKNDLILRNRSSVDIKSNFSHLNGSRLRRSARSSCSTETNEYPVFKREPEDEDFAEDATVAQLEPSSMDYQSSETLDVSVRIKCKYCPKEFASKFGASMHENVHTGNKPFKCGDCGKGFVYLHARTRHKKICNQTYRVECQKCHQFYPKHDYRSPHYLTCIMGKRSRTNSLPAKKQKSVSPIKDQDLSNVIIHHEEAQKAAEEYVSRVLLAGMVRYQCDFCRKTSSDKRNSLNCVCSHTGDVLFSCRLCNQTFTRRSRSVIHERFHTGEKPHKCAFCSTTFAGKMTRDRHQLGHDDEEKSFDCRKCGRWFKIEKTWEMHQRLCSK